LSLFWFCWSPIRKFHIQCTLSAWKERPGSFLYC
jgi:hypothetical protein